MNVTEKCILELMKRFETELSELGDERPLTRSLDELTLAVLYLLTEGTVSVDNRSRLSKLFSRAEEMLRWSGTSNDFLNFLLSEIDGLPWVIARELLIDDLGSSGSLYRLYRLLTDPASNTRLFAFNLTWVLREHLGVVEVVDRLFKNVADTLGYVEYAIGLARSFFNSDEDFLSAAGDFEPESFPEQYADRIQQLSDDPARITQYVSLFERQEVRVRRMIWEMAENFEVSGEKAANQIMLPFA